MSKVLLLGVALYVSANANAKTAPTDCEQRLSDARSSMLKLDYAAFDQTEGSGFRVLARAGCKTQAADLIEAYIATNGSTESSLTWHIAQLRAEAGETAAALISARKVLRADEAADAPFKWNDYVSAVIAFLEKDRPTFELHLARVLGAAQLHPGNALNGKLLEKLQAGFDGTYMEAFVKTP
jgi:hypothetical protein